ncbi:MAG: hypothetical protein QOF72_1125 [Blastocatellia bacterium]|jgi:hypothetical protein|nr:hypothetical protein [Blastocatellia bacterium]MDX6575207.1 hypothetical protein [Blastocatellia bacterium]
MKFNLPALLLSGVVLIGAFNPARVADAVGAADKLSVEEIVSKHLESIGSASARAAAGGRVIGGSTQVTFRSSGIAQSDGGAVLASEGIRSMVTMKFASSQYPYEKIGFDGNKVTAYQLPGAMYSSLGSFARANPEMLKDGLIGGTLSSAWPLLDLSSRKAKLESVGTKKVDSRQLVEIRYLPRGGSDLKISLFFDANSFQHVRTVYEKVISAQMGRTVDQSARMSETRYRLVEEFSDFKTEGGMTLPHTYKIHFEQQGASTQISDWVMTLVKFAFNQHMGAGDFDVSGE